MKANDIKVIKWIIEFFIVAIALITAPHTVWFAAQVFEGQDPTLTIFPLAINKAALLGIFYAFGLDIGMVFAAYSIGKSSYLPFSVSLAITFVINLFVSVISQMYYTLHHTGAEITPYWQHKLVPFMDAVPVIAFTSLGIIATSFVISSMVLSQYERIHAELTTKVVHASNEYYFPQKTAIKRFGNAKEMLTAATHYFSKKRGQQFLEARSDELTEWFGTQSGKLWLDTPQGKDFRKNM